MGTSNSLGKFRNSKPTTTKKYDNSGVYKRTLNVSME